MQTKLTLRLDSELIERAKAYASSTGRSVSQLVSDYFAVLGTDESAVEDEVPAIVQALHGCLAGASLDEPAYQEYLTEKYGGVQQ
jgi:hypothetical protein